MFQKTCKCGKTTKSFKKLKESDFPDVWEIDCCLEMGAQSAVEPEEPAPEPVVEPMPDSKEEIPSEPEQVSESEPKAAVEETPRDSKRKGRKRKK